MAKYNNELAIVERQLCAVAGLSQPAGSKFVSIPDRLERERCHALFTDNNGSCSR